MRARRPHPGNFRVWPFPPSAFLSPGCPRLPPAVPGGRSAQAPAEEESQPARGPPDSRPGTRPCREALPLRGGRERPPGGSDRRRNWHLFAERKYFCGGSTETNSKALKPSAAERGGGLASAEVGLPRASASPPSPAPSCPRFPLRSP